METTNNDSMRRDISELLSKSRRRSFSLRMAPMIAMIFLLLIFFLVAAKWRPQEDFLPFQLPTAQGQSQRPARPEPLEIYIFAAETGCRVQVGRVHTVQIENETIEANLVELMEKINTYLLEQKRFAEDPIEIICNGQVKWEHLAKIYNLFYGAGLTDITFRMTE